MEVAGVATGDRGLEGEGKLDQAKGKVKGSFERAKQLIEEATWKKDEGKPEDKGESKW